MKYLITLSAVAAYVCIAVGCGKNNDYSAVDHSVGVVKMRKWSGKAYGNCRLDSSYLNPVTHVVEHKILLKPYSRAINDSLFTFEKIDNFTIKVFGYWMAYDKTDDRSHLVVFDSVYNRNEGGKDTSFVIFNSSTDTMKLELHILSNQDPYTTQYFQDHWILHTVD